MSESPFDIRTVLLAKHAQHVVLIHFPIALFIAAVMFDFCAQWTKNLTLAAAAYFNLLLAAISTIPVVATGIVAWRLALEGQKAERHSVRAPGFGLHLSRPDLVRFQDPSTGSTESAVSLAEYSAADRSNYGAIGRFDGAPRRVFEWSERAGLTSLRSVTVAPQSLEKQIPHSVRNDN